MDLEQPWTKAPFIQLLYHRRVRLYIAINSENERKTLFSIHFHYTVINSTSFNMKKKKLFRQYMKLIQVKVSAFIFSLTMKLSNLSYSFH